MREIVWGTPVAVSDIISPCVICFLSSVACDIDRNGWSLVSKTDKFNLLILFIISYNICPKFKFYVIILECQTKCYAFVITILRLKYALSLQIDIHRMINIQIYNRAIS